MLLVNGPPYLAIQTMSIAHTFKQKFGGENAGLFFLFLRRNLLKINLKRNNK